MATDRDGPLPETDNDGYHDGGGVNDGYRDEAASGSGASEADWKRMGFESHLEMMEDLERSQMSGRPIAERNAFRAVAGLEPLPSPEQETVEAMPAPRQGPTQVGVRLSATDYRILQSEARNYGVAPTTLARILLNRALRTLASAARKEQPDQGHRMRQANRRSG